METSITLCNGWLLATDPSNEGKEKGYAAAPIPGALPCRVPGVIQECFPTYEGVVWYYHSLSHLPARSEGERHILDFEGVDYACEVYLDGVLIGAHEGAQDSLSFDVTGQIAPGSLLALRVIIPKEGCENAIDGMWLPAVPHSNKGGGEFPIGGTYNYGGIVGDVTLSALPLLQNTGASPAGDAILLNLLREP